MILDEKSFWPILISQIDPKVICIVGRLSSWASEPDEGWTVIKIDNHPSQTSVVTTFSTREEAEQHAAEWSDHQRRLARGLG